MYQDLFGSQGCTLAHFQGLLEHHDTREVYALVKFGPRHAAETLWRANGVMYDDLLSLEMVESLYPPLTWQDLLLYQLCQTCWLQDTQSRPTRPLLGQALNALKQRIPDAADQYEAWDQKRKVMTHAQVYWHETLAPNRPFVFADVKDDELAALLATERLMRAHFESSGACKL